MRIKITAAALAVSVLLPRFAVGQNIAGSEGLAKLVAAVLQSCPGAAGLTYGGGGADRGEQALRDHQQETAPMSRFLEPIRTCQSATPKEAEGVLVALDAVALTGGADVKSSCGEVASVGSFEIIDRNGVPDLQCPGCSGTTYTLTDWRDVLRVLFTGMHHNAAADIGQQDCNSDVRHTLAESWPSLFAAACTVSGCTRLTHLWRAGDHTDAAELFLRLVGLPGRPANPFCNGAGLGPFADPSPGNHPLSDFADRDPVRRPCDANEDVCGPDGTMGLVLPVVVAEGTPPIANGDNYPTQSCDAGRFRLLNPGGSPTAVPLCPNGKSKLFGKCFQPVVENPVYPGGFSANCLARRTPVSFGSAGVDGRAWNLAVKGDDGRYRLDAYGRPVTGAFHRIHMTSMMTTGTATCRHDGSPGQIACLSLASPCSLGVTGLVGSQVPDTSAFGVRGIEPTLENVRRLIPNANDPLAYPLASRVLLNSMVGIDALQSPVERALVSCISDQNISNAAANAAALIPLGVRPSCVDFDERQCGTLFNYNACDKAFFELCPSVDFLSASPLQTNVGGQITLVAAASDLDGDALVYAWTATAGVFAAPDAPATTYTCTVVGAQTLVFHVWDGRCESHFDVPIQCVAAP